MHLRYSMSLALEHVKTVLTENDLLTFEPLEPTHPSPYSEGNIHQE